MHKHTLPTKLVNCLEISKTCRYDIWQKNITSKNYYKINKRHYSTEISSFSPV